MITRYSSSVAALAVILILPACRRGDKAAPADSSAVRTPIASGPAYNPALDCVSGTGDVVKFVCGDTALSSLDQRLGIVYKDAEARQGQPVPSWFTDEQRNWGTDRDACTARTDVRACLDSAYTRRIAYIQATSLLVPTKGPVTYSCNGADGHSEVGAMFAETDPPTVVLERGDKSVVGYLVRSASGAKYEGTNVVFWSKGSEAQVTWFGAALKCREQAPSS